MARAVRLAGALSVGVLLQHAPYAVAQDEDPTIVELPSPTVPGRVGCEQTEWTPVGECEAKTLTQDYMRLVAADDDPDKCVEVHERRQCFPVHCEMSAWSPWGECGVDGYKQRTRTAEVHPIYGGRGCPHDTQRVKCAPEDCIMCEWSDWVCDEYSGMQTRSRHLIRPPRDGGATCPRDTESKPCDPVDCVLDDDYEDWSECDDDGVKTKWQKIRTPAKFGGEECTPDVVKDMCPPEDCEVGEWGEWSECDSYGFKLRERSVIKEPRFGGMACEDLVEFGPCAPEECKFLAPYEDTGSWGPCTEHINGTWIRRKELGVKKDSAHDGNCTPPTIEEMCTPQNCQLSEWLEWTECDKNGVKTRRREVISKPLYGGEECDETEQALQCTDDVQEE